MPSTNPNSEVSRLVTLMESWNMSSKTIIALIVTGVLVAMVYGGWVLSVMWGWFLVPFGLPQINLAWAVGLHCLAVLLSFHRGPADVIHEDELAPDDLRRLGALVAVVDYTFLLMVGYVAHVLM